MLEAAVEGYLNDEVIKLGGETRKVKWIGRRGAPDRRVMLPRYCCWVECKKPRGGKLEAHQIREHRRMRSWGEMVHVISSKKEVDIFIAKYKKQVGRAC